MMNSVGDRGQVQAGDNSQELPGIKASSKFVVAPQIPILSCGGRVKDRSDQHANDQCLPDSSKLHASESRTRTACPESIDHAHHIHAR